MSVSPLEAPRSLPPKDVVMRWFESETARKVYLTLLGIDLARHGFDVGFREGLSEQYYDPEVAKLSPEEQLGWLKERMPVEDVRHAAYIPELDRLLVSGEDEFLTHIERTSVERQLEAVDAVSRGYTTLIGTVATVKENGWRIFDLMPLGYETQTKAIEASIEKLARRGIILLRHSDGGAEVDVADGKYEPIFPRQ